MMIFFYQHNAYTNSITTESVKACVITRDSPLTATTRDIISRCIGWKDSPCNICQGFYKPLIVSDLDDRDQVEIQAGSVSFNPSLDSTLQGGVLIHQTGRIVSAQTATIYRDPNTKKITNIKLLGNVKYLEPGRLMLARKASINPENKSGYAEDVLYRFNVHRASARFPAWGRAKWIERFANQNYLLQKATYTTCSPKDASWQIEAQKIDLDNLTETGYARNALLRVGGLPLFYTPYMSFPTSSARRSGFLLPLMGYSNVNGFDVATPFYWNIAPNYDATLIPHYYARRGVMLGGDLRFLTEHTSGIIGGNYLPNDAAFNAFLLENKNQFPILDGVSTDRWSFLLHENTNFTNHLHMNVDFQQVSDDYYLQDFSTNLAVITQNQILRQGDITYDTDHWLFKGMVQSYQTLHPINQSPVSNIYARLPQLMAEGHYMDLPLHANLLMLGQFDYFHISEINFALPEASRYHFNPILTLPQIKPWGYFTPGVELVQNNYNVSYQENPIVGSTPGSQAFNRTIPRFTVDGGLNFERDLSLFQDAFTQTLEPRLFYLNVPYQNQSQFPAFDSAYMIFNTDQLFRTNRFSGFDRIGDANQLAYAVTTRFLSADTGRERASFTVGQIKYFSDRNVQLCFNETGECVDSPLFLGYTSPVAETSPIASKGVYNISPAWNISGDYVWDGYTSATNNGDLNLHYQPQPNRILSLGYNYIVSGNVIEEPTFPIQDSALHQVTGAFAWPLTEKWSSLGVYSYNISKGYDMMSFLGLQYDTCCFAVRLIGGHTFKSLGLDSVTPTYNNNVYLQILLKGLGTVANSDPATTIQSFLPGYPNLFHQ